MQSAHARGLPRLMSVGVRKSLLFSSFVSGHGFSRAIGSEKNLGFSPCGLEEPTGAKALYRRRVSARLKPCPDTMPPSRPHFCVARPPGMPVLTNSSSTCVAQMTGMEAASQSQRISSWISARRRYPISTARSPRAIITAVGWRPAACTISPGRLSTPSSFRSSARSGHFNREGLCLVSQGKTAPCMLKKPER